jgi:hypothetical protein
MFFIVVMTGTSFTIKLPCLLLNYLGHEMEFKGHCDDVQTNDAGNCQVKVLAGGHSVDE